MGKTARDVMTPDAKCVGENDSVADAAKQLADLGVGSMPICGEDERLKGVVTDRDIVVEVLAAGKDPGSVTVKEPGRWQAGDDRSRRLGLRGAADHEGAQGQATAGDRRSRSGRNRQHR